IMHLPWRLRFQFVFSQLWYPLFSAFMAVMFLLPVAALMTGQVFVNVTYPDFLLHFAPISVVLTLFAFFWRATGTFRPHDPKLFGWEGLAFIFLRSGPADPRHTIAATQSRWSRGCFSLASSWLHPHFR
ncbi:hypothetical protein ACC771_07405, partial [Rhizobium ruizarguesonis]